MGKWRDEIQKEIKQTVATEIIRTYFAEMLDSKITLQNSLPSTQEVSQMYLFKTARYTFSLPLQLAGITNNLKISDLETLIKIGENLGENSVRASVKVVGANNFISRFKHF